MKFNVDHIYSCSLPSLTELLQRRHLPVSKSYWKFSVRSWFPECKRRRVHSILSDFLQSRPARFSAVISGHILKYNLDKSINNVVNIHLALVAVELLPFLWFFKCQNQPVAFTTNILQLKLTNLVWYYNLERHFKASFKRIIFL